MSSASAQTTEAKAISSASVELGIGQATDAVNFLSSLSAAAVAWTNSVANAVFSVATSGGSVSQATWNVATAWQQSAFTSATAESSAASTGMTALISYVTSVATAAKTESDAQADAAEARVIASGGDALTATAEEATAATIAAKAMAGAEAIAEIASALASQAWVQVTAAADLTFANSSIDASLTASNNAVDAVHAYVVASIGVNLIASTAATGFALLREHSAIAAMTTAQKDAINAACTATLANLASDLIGRNASEALDDPIAIAAATNNAAQAVKAAWENVNNLQARAAITFAGTGPGAGGLAMGVAGFFSWESWSQFVISWDYPLGDMQTGWFAQTSNFFAGWGDTLSFGLTSGFRSLLGYNSAVDFESNAYFGGQIVGTFHGFAMMGANASANMLRQGSVLRYFWDPRTWRSVVRTWSGSPASLKVNALSLHHVLIPQRWGLIPQGIRNAGFNYMAMSAWRNSVTLNRLAPFRPIEWAYRFGYLTQLNPFINPLIGQFPGQ